MVIGKKFAWAHFGKTGGDSVHRMFQVISRHVLYADPIERPEKHLTFHVNERRLGYDLTHSRKRIMNIRRLPSWLLSFMNHKHKFHSVPILKESYLRGAVLFERNDPDALGNGAAPNFMEVKIDKMLEDFMCDRIDYWIRTEYLADDFIMVMGRFMPINASQKREIRKIRINVNQDYDRDIFRNFSTDELELIYRNCPLWTRIEREAFGGTLLT